MQALERTEQILDWLRSGRELDARRAGREIDKWLKRDPRNSYALFLRGLSLAIQRKLKDALHCYDIAVAGLPELQVLRYNRSSILLSLQQYEEGLEEAYRALDMEGQVANSSIVYNISQALLELGRFDEALAPLQELLGRGHIEFSLLFPLFAIKGDFEGIEEVLSLLGTRSAHTQSNTLVVFEPPRGSFFELFDPWVMFLEEAAMQGHSASLIMDCVDLPPSELVPATADYIGWWRKELSHPDWEDSVRATLELLADETIAEKLQESQNEPKEARVAWADLKTSLGL